MYFFIFTSLIPICLLALNISIVSLDFMLRYLFVVLDFPF